MRNKICLLITVLFLGTGPTVLFGKISDTQTDGLIGSQRLLLGVGDSLTHGTMDGANNDTNTLNGFMQKVAEGLEQVMPLLFSQPLLNDEGDRLMPFRLPTNLGIDGEDIFSVEGLEYYKRVGADDSFIVDKYLCDEKLPFQFDDKHDKVLYPINLLAKDAVSQIDAAIWWLNQRSRLPNPEKTVLLFWLGNNDAGLAALGVGGSHPNFFPIPFDQIAPELKPLLRILLQRGEEAGEISFEPYTPEAINRNLTEPQDFTDQYQHILTRLQSEADLEAANAEIFLFTLPYYSTVGYLFDSDDLEFYLQKVQPDYLVPPTFARVAPPNEPITDPLKGDRVSFFTFGLMYVLLSTGASVEYVNESLEVNGQQQDGLVLSEAEQQQIMSRMDHFNQVIKNAAMTSGPRVHLIDIGQFLNDGLSGETPIVIDGKELTRKWIRGNVFSLDGVHPGYMAQALIANVVLEELNAVLGLSAPLHDLSSILSTDPYIDNDEDGWAPGPNYQPSGLTELLFLFTDSDDANPMVEVQLPPDVWEFISDVLLREFLNVPFIQQEAERLGISPMETLQQTHILELEQNFPNPFNPETWIPYWLNEPARVSLTIYNAQGNVVRHIDLGLKPVGAYDSKDTAIYWDGRNDTGERVASGVYFYRLQAGDFAATKKMIILK